MKARHSHRLQDGGCGTRSKVVRNSFLTTLALLLSLTMLPGLGISQTQTADQMSVSVGNGDSGFDFAAQPLRVNVWVDKESGDVYRRGETVRVYFESNEDAYAVVYRIDSEGEVDILWPRSRYDDGFIFGHHQYKLPAAGAERIQAADEEGVEYVEAIVSRYPFDLRDLEVDFHHEAAQVYYSFRVAGDPFLAMNEVNFAVTGLEDPADYVVTNYTSYYVHRQVDHPRYLCGQCHEDDYQPYSDRCSVDIHFDYGWYNRWYVRFGYYPVYGYPAFYYVDPWTWRPWVNYWYTPWYRWPGYSVYAWPHDYYVWHHSPYWYGDSWVRWRDGHRRYTPLARRGSTIDRDRDSLIRRKNSMVRRGGEPSSEMKRAMQTRSRLEGGRTGGSYANIKGARPARQAVTQVKYRNVEQARRDRVAFREPAGQPRGSGLRIRSTESSAERTRATIRNPRSGANSPRTQDRDHDAREVKRTPVRGTNQRSVDRPQRLRDTERSVESRRSENQSQRRSTDRNLREQSTRPDRSTSGNRTIRSVEPRKKGSRIWSGGRQTPAKERTARPQRVRPQTDKSSQSSGAKRNSKVESRSGGSKRSSQPSRVQPKSGSNRSSGKKSIQRSPRSSGGSRPANRSSGSSSSRGSGRSGGGRSSRDGGSRRG